MLITEAIYQLREIHGVYSQHLSALSAANTDAAEAVKSRCRALEVTIDTLEELTKAEVKVVSADKPMPNTIWANQMMSSFMRRE